jgi:pilus assembly protein Flp/PilA
MKLKAEQAKQSSEMHTLTQGRAISGPKFPLGGTMLTTLMAFLRNEEGQSLAEYALILVLVSIAAIGAMTALGGDISATFSSVSGTLGGS